MAPFRKPAFSQGSAWLPPWLLCSSIQSDVRMFDTPSILIGSTKDIDELTLSSNARINSCTVLKDCTNQPDHMLCLSEDPLTNPNRCEIIQNQYFQIDTTLNQTSHCQKHEALVLQLSLSPRSTQANSSTEYHWELETDGCDISMYEGKNPLSTTQPVVQASIEAIPQFEKHLQCGTSIDMPKNKIMEENFTSCGPPISDLSESRLPTKPCLLAAEAICGSGGNSQEWKCKFSHEQDVKRSAAKHRTASVKRIKGSGSNIGNEDVQAAIGLTVATAEALVIAEIMNGCLACQECGPSAVLDAALKVKREREMCGLNDFTLECMAQENSCDLNWYKGLDEASLEEEYLLVRPMEAAKYAEHSLALTDPNLLGRNSCESPRNLTSTLCSGDGMPVNHEDSSLKQLEQQNQLSHDKAVDMKLVNSSSPSTTNFFIVSSHTHQCYPAQPQMASKESFSSRWFGGWTGMDQDLEKPTCQNKERNLNNQKLLQLETSDLSESWDVGTAPISCNNAWKTQKKGDLDRYTSGLSIENVEDQHKEMSTAGSCAEILMAMSQASVKCSSSALQEPLCSFVPCSITKKAIACGTGELHNPAVNVFEQGKFMGNMMVPDTSQDGPDDLKPEDQRQCVSNILIQDGVKRIELSSLKHHSASPFSPLLEAVRLEIGKQQFLQTPPEVVREPERTESEHTAKADVLNIFENKTKTNDQNKIDLQCLELQESPPLTWHRGKKHRLRACRIVDSALIDGTDVDYLPDMITDHQLMAIDKQVLGKPSTIATCNPSEEASPKGSNIKVSPECLIGSPEYKSPVHNQQGGKSYNLRGRTCSHLFEGLQFLLTGFPPKQKALCEEVGQKIKDNSGALLTTVPSISTQWSNRMHEWQHKMAHCPIIIAPQKVRTMKYLYGCAVGSLIVKPSWLDECISSNSILHKNKDPEKGIKCDYTTHTFLRFKEESKCLIFKCIAAFLHGQEEYCAKLSSLVQHGGGRILQSLQNPVHGTSSIHLVVVEHQSRIPGGLKQQAARLGLPIVAGDWIIKSLLDGRLLPLPDSALWKQKACADGTQSASLTSRKRKGCVTGNQFFSRSERTLERKALREKKVPVKRKVITQVDGSDYIYKERNPPHSRRKSVTELCVTFLGKGMATPELSRQRLSFDFLFPKHCKRYHSVQPSQSSYYREVCVNGIIYSAGDIVEIHPYMEDEKEPYIAQIESFYAGPESGVKTRAVKAQNRKLARPCLMCCRWFYRPSDTGFPCLGHDNELYLSEHFDDKVPVHNIIKKVTLQLIVDGKILTNNDERGWGLAPQGSTSAKSTDYICKFFYDYTKESLHHLKSSLRS